MKSEEHALNLGKLINNFHSLEFVLRVFLGSEEVGSSDAFLKSINPDGMKDGDIVPENAFTNYDTLGQLIEKYNSDPQIIRAGLTIDPALVNIRDAIAHGRVACYKPVPPFKLLKFEKPMNKHVKVTYSILLTEEWFNASIADVQTAILKVYKSTKQFPST